LRATPTAAEALLKDELLEHFKRNGQDAEIVGRVVNDNPDLLFRVDGELVACECVQIPPADVFRWAHTRWKETGHAHPTYCVLVVWPEESHSWVNQVIAAKSRKVGDYRLATGANRVALLIHAPLLDSKLFQPAEFPWQLEVLRYGASISHHPFDEIYHWDRTAGIRKIFPTGDKTARPRFNFEGGYPTRSFAAFGGFPFTPTPAGASPHEHVFGPIEPKLIIVPPIDPEFARHPPRLRKRKYLIRIVAGATNAQISNEILWE
jgi:hypothetical protein